MSDAVFIALATGPAVLLFDRALSWLRNRRKDDAETGLTVDQRWQAWADELARQVNRLQGRIEVLEKNLGEEQDRRKNLEAEVSRYKRIARSLARHVLKLRDELSRTATAVPVLPADVEEALTIIELP